MQLSGDTHGPAQSTYGLTVTGCPVTKNKVKSNYKIKINTIHIYKIKLIKDYFELIY